MAEPSKRALVVVNEQVAGEELRRALVSHLDGDGVEVFVVAPVLAGSGLKHTLGDIDDAVAPARERLRRSLEELRRAGIEADGELGDSDPIQAISDEVEKFHPEQVLVVGHHDSEAAFAERGLLEQAERDFDLPVVELFVDHEAEPHVLDEDETHAGADGTRGWRPSGNMPPLSIRDVLGIFVAIVGTLALGVLAAKNAADEGGGQLGAQGVAMLLIALFMALINLAHVVGIFLFESVSYRGMFSRMFARLSLLGTPVAVAAALILYLA